MAGWLGDGAQCVNLKYFALFPGCCVVDIFNRSVTWKTGSDIPDRNPVNTGAYGQDEGS